MREQADDDILDAEITARAARLAYEQAGLGPQDVDVVELHDAFTIAELLYYEALGLADHGEAVALLRSGATRSAAACRSTRAAACSPRAIRSAPPASRRWSRSLWQLQGRAGARQVEGAKRRPDAMHRRRHRRRRPRGLFRSSAGSVR